MRRHVLLLACVLTACVPSTMQRSDDDETGFVASVSGALTALSPSLSVRVERAVTLAHRDGSGSMTLRTEGAGARPRRASDGSALREIAPGMTERVEVRGDSIEQSWSIAERPSAPLTVRVKVEGASWLVTDAAGLHFQSHHARSGFVYGHGTLVDRDGRRTAVPARWTGDAIELTIDEATAAGALFPAVLDPIVGPEVGVVPPVDVPDHSASAPQVRFDGTQWWVLYTSNSRPSTTLRLARVSLDGRLLDPYGIEVASDAGVTDARFAISGRRALVVWSYSRGIFARRVELATGTVLDPAPLRLDRPTGENGSPSVASDGTDFYVTYDHYARDVMGRRVLSDGTVVGTEATTLATANRDPRVVFSRDHYVVLMRNGSTTVRALRVGRDGAPLDAAPVTVHTPSGRVQEIVATECDGAVLALVASSTPFALEALRIDGDGALGIGPVHALPGGSAGLARPAVGAWGAEAVASWWISGVADSAQFQPLDRDGAPTGSPTLVQPGATAQRAVAVPGPASTFAVWESPDDPPALRGARFRDDGSTLETAPLVLAFRAPRQGDPVVGFGAGVHVVSWLETTGLTATLRVARLGPGGTPLDTVGTLVTSRPPATPLDIASAGSELMLIWSQGSTVWGARIDGTGAILATDIPLVTVSASSVTAAAIASDGSQYFLAWIAGALFSGALNVQRFAVDGTAIGTPTTLATTAFRPLHVAFTDGVFGIQYGTVGGTLPHVGLQRVRADGTRIDTSPAFDSSSECATSQHGQLAAGAGLFVNFLCWDGREMSTVVVPASGSAGPRRTVYDTFPGTGAWLGAAFDGASYVGIARLPDEPQLMGFVLDDTGFEGVEPRFEVTADENVGSFPGLSAQDDGGLLFVYRRNLPEAPFGGDRVRARYIGSALGLGAPCATEAACTSGHCVDGVCCDSSCGGGRDDDCYACAEARGATRDGRCSTASAGTVCREALDACDAPDACDGSSVLCPPDAPLICDDMDACTADGCDPIGGCRHEVLPTCIDAGAPVDASLALDADVPDAARPDAAASHDAAARADTSVVLDAHSPDAAIAPAPPTGCACRSAGRRGGPSAGVVLLVLAVAVAGRRAWSASSGTSRRARRHRRHDEQRDSRGS